MNNSSPLFDMIMLILSWIIIVICDIWIIKLLVFIIYMIYIFVHKYNLKDYFSTFLKGMIIGIPLFLILLLFQVEIIDSMIIFLEIILFATSFITFSLKYSTMEIYFAFSCILAPINLIGFNSNKVGWLISKFIRDIKIYINVLYECVNSDFEIIKYFKKFSLYDRINISRQRIKVINKLTRFKIDQLDQMMHLRLFDFNYYRTNYYTTNIKIKELLFIILQLCLLLSGVIL